MGRQEGLLQFTGGVGNLSFYNSQDGYLVRKKSGVSRERIMSDRAYVRTRENIAEFGTGARATKLLRRAFGPLIRTVADNRVTSRLTSAVMKVIKSDTISPRGQRNVGDGDMTLLQGFEFNKHARLATTFGAPFTASVDRVTGSIQIDIPAFSPANLITAPEGATHFRLKALGVAIDFGADTYSAAASESEYLPLEQTRQTELTLTRTVAKVPGRPLLLAFGIEFVQLVNGVQYPLKDEMKNAMAIVKVVGVDRNELRAKPACRRAAFR